MKRLVFLLCFGVLETLLFLSNVAMAKTRQFHVTRDLWISSSCGEEEGSNGATTRLKLKGYQEFSLIDFDLADLKGVVIKRATLRLKRAGAERLYRVGVGTITSEWNEGSGTNYEREVGASSFRWKANPEVPWLDSVDDVFVTDYSDITSVIFGEGGSFWDNADATDPENEYQYINVAPEVVAARIAGLSYGFVLFDDTGTEVIKNGEETIIRLFPNRFVYSREQNKSCEPVLEVEYDDNVEVLSVPDSPMCFSYDISLASRGILKLSWQQRNCISDSILGFRIRLDGVNVPQYVVPAPSIGNTPVIAEELQCFSTNLHGIDPKTNHVVEIVSVDLQGNESTPTSLDVYVSKTRYDAWESIVKCNSEQGSVLSNDQIIDSVLPVIGKSEVTIIQNLDRYLEDGTVLPAVSNQYLIKNSIWNATTKTIDLVSARNEFIGFQIALKGTTQKLWFDLLWDENNRQILPKASFYRFARVNSEIGRVPDPVIPLDVKERAALIEGTDSVLCEIFVPAIVQSGILTGKLRLINEKNETLELLVRLTVWDFSLPNELSFFPEMNCYSLPDDELEYYRLAQLHRTYINRVPYSHRGTIGDGLAPLWDPATKSFEWNQWIERFGKYFDGSAFADLPRGAVPIEAFYLPLFENFPANIFEGFAGDFIWPDSRAFTEEYKTSLCAGCRSFAEKIAEEEWNQTRFLFFLNNKNDYKKSGWNNASSPWLLDEPASFRDFAALSFFAKMLRESVADRVELKDKIFFRADISRPQWERNSLETLLDVYVLSSEQFRLYNREIRRRKGSSGSRLIYVYGTTTPPSESAYQPVFWAIDAWSTGADGIVPWQTIGDADSWKNEDELSLFYPASNESDGKVAASIRLKAYRSGEQLIEYLTILTQASGLSRDEVSYAVRKRLRLDDVVMTRIAPEDAGVCRYKTVSSDELELFRREIGCYLNNVAR